MDYTLPHTIENCIGERLVFHRLENEGGEDKLIVENFVMPGGGPPMHTHHLQDEALTVVKGKMGYQVLGEDHKFAVPGETVIFRRGTPHRFWNAGEDILNCVGWVKPANSLIFFLTSIYAAQNKSGKADPEMFDGAYLMRRYAQEYDLPGIPPLVKKILIPMTYLVGRLIGKYKHFEGAPEPLKAASVASRQ